MCRPIRVFGKASTTLPIRTAKSINRFESSAGVMKFPSKRSVLATQLAMFTFQFPLRSNPMDKPLKRYFDTVGPCNLPMKDKQAKSLECRLKNLPKEDAYAFRRLSITRGMTELLSEGRCDVSWITEQTPDRTGDVVLAAGMDDSHFQLNPIVTLNHCYTLPPVG